MKLSLTFNSVSITYFPHKFVLWIFIFVCTQNIYAQTLSSPEIMNCNAIGQEEGLIQLNVKCMAQDELGYLWLGTEDGLLRYNGYEFKAFLHNPNDSASIDDDHIRGMTFNDGVLWLATNTKGICYYVLSEDRFYSIQDQTQNPELNTGYKVFLPKTDTLIFSLENHLMLANQKNGDIQTLPLPLSGRECVVNDIIEVKNGKYWLATSSEGIVEADSKTFDYEHTKLLNKQPNNCFYKTKQHLFIGTEQGLFRYNLNSEQLSSTTFGLPVNCFYKLDDNSFFMGSDVGLYIYNLNNNTITPQFIQTQDNVINSQVDVNQILGDEKGNIWIGTEGDGLFHYNRYQKKFQPIYVKLKEFPFISNISTFQFLPGKDSSLWLGTKYGMVNYSLKTGNFKFYDSEPHALIYTISKDEYNTIWAGGFTTGLLKYDESNDVFRKLNIELSDEDIVEIIPRGNHNLLICTWAGGIYEFNSKTSESAEYLVDGKRINRARTSLLDSKGNLWLGTDQGAYCIHSSGNVKRYQTYTDSLVRLSGDRVFDITEDTEGNIWFGTNVGLTKLDIEKGKTTLYYTQKGLPNDFIYSVLIAPNNDVWVSTNYGISVLRHATNSFTNYTVSDGLQNNEFNGKAGYQDDQGNFYLGGISGINIFNPSKIIENPHNPNVYIESVELFNKPLSKNELFVDKLSFKSKENVLTLNFAALNFLEHEKCNYTYKMEGFDTDWRPTGKNRSTTYTNLDPGTYVFQVKATNDAGIWSPFTDSLEITIVPPWYASNWFRVLFIVGFLLSGLLFYFQTSKLKKDKIKLERIVDERTRQVQIKNDELQKAFHEAASQRDNVRFLMKELKHRVNNNLQIISSLLNIQANTTSNKEAVTVLEMARNRIMAIANVENKIKNNSEIVNVADFIRDIAESIIKALSTDKKLKFSPVYELSDFEVQNINTTLIGLVLNELITNVNKYAFDEYAQKNTLRIVCKMENEKLILIVADNGKGYKANDIRKNSMGLNLVSGMVSQLNGTIKTDSSNGTTNRIEIPV